MAKARYGLHTLKSGAYVPSPEEVEAACKGTGGFKKETLARWGVPWPPFKGWRKLLKRKWEIQQETAPPKPPSLVPRPVPVSAPLPDPAPAAKTFLLERYEKKPRRPVVSFDALMKAAEMEFNDTTHTTARLRESMKNIMRYASPKDRKPLYAWMAERYAQWYKLKTWQPVRRVKAPPQKEER